MSLNEHILPPSEATSNDNESPKSDHAALLANPIYYRHFHCQHRYLVPGNTYSSPESLLFRTRLTATERLHSLKPSSEPVWETLNGGDPTRTVHTAHAVWLENDGPVGRDARLVYTRRAVHRRQRAFDRQLGSTVSEIYAALAKFRSIIPK